MSGRKIGCRKRGSSAQVCRLGHRSSWQMGREEEGTLAANTPTSVLSSLSFPPPGSSMFPHKYSTALAPYSRQRDPSVRLLYSHSNGKGSYRSSIPSPISTIRSGPPKYLNATTKMVRISKGCLVSTTIHDIRQEGEGKVDYKPNSTHK